MKLSELSTDKALDKICDVIPFIEEITQDKEVKKIINEKVKALANEDKEKVMEKGMEKGIEKILKIIPLILRKKRESVYNIISIMNEKEIEVIRNQSPIITIKEIKELLADEELRALFF